MHHLGLLSPVSGTCICGIPLLIVTSKGRGPEAILAPQHSGSDVNNGSCWRHEQGCGTGMPSKLNLPHLASRRRREAFLKATGVITAAVCAALLLYQSRHICAAVHPSSSVLLSASSARTSAAQSAQDRTPLYKPCTKGCEEHGNCNFEEGRCE